MNERLAVTLERFERRFLFRAARILPLGLGAVAAIILVFAALGFAYSVIPSFKGKPPEPNPPPPEVALTREDVAGYLRSLEASRPASRTAPAPGSTDQTTAASPPSLEATGIASKLHALRQIVARRNLAWANETETYCESQFLGSCYSYATRVARSGVGPILLEVLARYDTGDRVEAVTAPGTTESYRVNSTGSATKLHVLDEITTIFAESLGEEMKMLRGWSALRQDREQQRRETISADEARVASAAADIELRHMTAQAKKGMVRWTSMQLLGTALGVLFMTGVALAILAIERNTRAMQRLIATLPTVPDSP